MSTDDPIGAALERARRIAQQRVTDTAKLSKLASTGNFDPPCDPECPGVIHYPHDGDLLIGQCPLENREPPCLIPERNRREVRAEMQWAGFPRRYLDSVWSECRAETVLREWLIDRPKPGLLIHGPVGTGKTSAAVLVSMELWVEGVFCQFYSWPNLLLELEQWQTRRGAVSRATRGGMLIVDDFGVGDVAPWAAGSMDLIFEMRNSRRLGTIVTTNLTTKTIDEEVDWKRMVDRWRESMIRVAIPGKSMRSGSR